MAAQDISELVLKVTSDGISEATQKLKDMKQAAAGAEDGAKKLAKSSEDGAKQQASAIENLLKKMEAQVALLGKNTSESNAYKAAMKGATEGQVAQAAALGASVDAYRKAEKATSDASKAAKQSSQELAQAAIQRKRDLEMLKNSEIDYMMAQQKAIAMNKQIDDSLKGVTRGHGSNAAAMRESMVMIHELSQGSYKRFGGSLMVFANQLNVIPTLMEKIGATTRLMQFAVLGSIAAIGLLGFAMYQGGAEVHKFNNALIVTGNVAGVTAKSVEDMAHTISDSTGNGLANSRNMLHALAESGTVTQENMAVAGIALTDYARLTGKSSDEVVKEFEGMKNGVYKFALEHNKTTGALSANTLQSINDLELLGKTAEAGQLYWLALDGHLNQTQEKLSGLGQVMRDVANVFKEGWHAIGHLSVEDSFGEQLDKAAAKLAKAKTRKGTDVFGGFFWDGKIQAAQADINRLTPLAKQESDEATAKSAETTARIEGGKAYDEILKIHKRVKDKGEKLDTILKRLDVDIAKARAGKDGATITEEMIKDYKDDATEKYNKEHKVKGNDDRTALREVELEEIRGNNLQKIHLAEEGIRASKEMATKQNSDERYELARRNDMRAEELVALRDNYNQELAIIKAYANEGGHTKVELARNKLRGTQLKNRFNNETSKIGSDGEDDARSVTSREIAEQEKLEKAINQTAATEQKRLEKELESAKVRLAGIDDLKSVKMQFQAAEEARFAKNLENDILLKQWEIEDGVENHKWDQNKVNNANAQIAAMRVQIGLHKQIGEVITQESEAQRKLEERNRTTKNLDDALAAAKRFEKGMTDAFGKIGHAIGGMASAFAQMNKDRDTASANFAAASKEDLANGKAKGELDRANAQAAIAGYGGITQAAQGMFTENSKGYQAMGAMSKIFHVAEAAMAAARIIQLGIAAVLTQGTGDPYTAFARMAAMAAIVTGLGVAVSAGGSNGGRSAKDNQAIQGSASFYGKDGKLDTSNLTGGVFGDAKAKSESISKSLDALKNNSGEMLPLTNAMLASLKNIESSMVGLTNLVVRTQGLTEGTNMGIQTGTLNKGIQGVVGDFFHTTVGLLVSPVMTLVSRLWGKTTQNIVDSGIGFSGRVGDLQHGQGFNQFASVDTTKSSWFGLSKSTSNSVQTQGLSDELTQQFGLVFSNLEKTLKIAAPALGKCADDVGSAIENLVLNSTVSLKGLSGKELTDALNNVLSQAMDDIAKASFPEMDEFRQVGEGYAQTVVRVASSVEQAQVALKDFGITAIAFTDVADKSGDVAFQMVQQSISLTEAGSGVGKMVNLLTGSVDDLVKQYAALVSIRKSMSDMHLGTGLSAETIEAAGGTAKLASALDGYYDKFFNAQEKAAIETANLTDKFAAIGHTLPATRQELRLWIETAAKAGDQQQIGKLLSLAGALDSLFDSIDKASQAVVDTSVDDAFKALEAAVNAQKKIVDAAYKASKDLTKKIHDDRLAALKSEADAAKAATGKTQDALKTTISSIQSILGTLKQAIVATNPVMTQAQAHAKAMKDAQAGLDAVNGGKSIGEVGGLDDALKELAKPTEAMYSSLFDYQVGQAEANNLLNSLQNAGETQLSDAQATLAVLDKIDADLASQTEAENARFKTEQDQLDADHQAAIDALDKTLDMAQQQLDALKGIDATIMSVADALAAFGIAVNKAKAAQGSAAGGGTTMADVNAYSTKYGGNAYLSRDILGEGIYDSKKGSVALSKAHDLGMTNLPAGQMADMQSWSNDDWWRKLTHHTEGYWQTIQQMQDAGLHPTEDDSSIPGFSVGTNSVPDDMLANIHKGERIIPAADNAELMRRLKDNNDSASSTTSAEVIDAKLDVLIDVIMRGDIANVQKSNDFYRIVRDWEANGMPPTRTTS